MLASEVAQHWRFSSARKFGLGFWKPGSGIIHQVVLENVRCCIPAVLAML
jgi:aconitase A